MTLRELKLRVKVKRLFLSEYGILVTVVYRDKQYSCFSDNNSAYNRIRISTLNKVPDRAERLFYTLKAAYLTFYDECKAKNGLKISKNKN